jgi:hypothetical protein
LSKRPLLIDEQLFFVHVPKCAGTSFISLIDEMFVNSEICPTHYDLRKFTKGEISNDELQGYKFIRGHFPYDLIIPRLKVRPRLITFLRDPITQFISYYQMRKRVPDPISGMQEQIKDLTLDEFLDRSPYVDVIANNATKLFAGIPAGDRLFDFSTTIDVPLAKKHLEECEFIGITEEYRNSIELFCHLFGVPPLEQHRELNVSPDRDQRREIGPKTLERIAEIQFADMELYEHGKRLFQKAMDQMTEERKKRIIALPFFTPSPLKNEISFDFRRVFPGMGWQVGEEHPVHKIIRWSGPGTVSKLFFPISKRRDVRIEFHVVSWVKDTVLDSLELFVNGETVLLKKEPMLNLDGCLFSGRIPKQVLKKRKGSSEFTFRVKETLRPIDIMSNNPDERQIGLCYTHISIEPCTVDRQDM